MSEDRSGVGFAAANESLRAAAYESLIKQFPNGVIVLFDADLRYLLVGPSTLPFSGRNADDMEGKTIWELFPEETADELAPHYRAALSGETRTFDVTFEDRIHNLTAKPVDAPGETRLGMVVTQDVTDSRRRERALETQNTRLEQFASIVSHDLRNPLGVAKGYLELERESRDSAALERVAAALERIDSIVENLLLAAREGENVEELEWVSLQSVADAAWAMMAAEGAELAVTTDVMVACDPERLQRIFENLFRNSVEHAGPDVTVTVGALPDGFSVTDDGPGIPEDIRQTAFEPGVTTAARNTGLGLFIVKSLSDAHQWTVTIEETADGTRFAFHDVRTRDGSETR